MKIDFQFPSFGLQAVKLEIFSLKWFMIQDMDNWILNQI